MKRILSAVLMMAVLLCLSACGNSTVNDASQSTAPTTDALEHVPTNESADNAAEGRNQTAGRIRCLFEDGSVGYIEDLTDTVTTKAFISQLPTGITLSDWDQREYYYAMQLPYASEDAQTTYAPGEFTYWCGGWVTAYYDTNDDTVIEAGSVVIGMMDEVFLEKLKTAGGASVKVRFEVEEVAQEEMSSESEKAFSTWDEVPVNKYQEKTIEVDYNGQTIWGVAYIPETGLEKNPLVICSHGLGGDYTSCMEYAELLASHGLATYCFDFRGGGGSHSDGRMTEMSLITEATDILTVIDAAKAWDFVDTEKILLFGESQGGAASAIAAARTPESVNGLILCYPALLVHDSVHEEFDSLDEVPASFFFKWLTVGRPYVADVWDYDVYSEIGNYTRPVLLMHGDRDGIVPIRYAERAAEVYPDVEYAVIPDGGHGFYGSAFDTAAAHILTYLQELDIL